MKKALKLVFILLTAFTLAGITFLLNKAYLNKHTQFQQIAVATDAVTPFGPVTKYQLEKVVTSAVPEDAITDLSYLEKTDWFAGKIGIGQGDVIRKSRLVNDQNNPYGKALALKQDKILVGIKTDQVFSAGNNLRPGVLAHAFAFIPGNGRDSVDRVVGPSQEAAYANLLIKEVQNADVTQTAQKGREALPVVAVVETTSAVAQKLVLAQELGKVYLTPSGVDLDSAKQMVATKNQTSTSAGTPTSTSASKIPAITAPNPNQNYTSGRHTPPTPAVEQTQRVRTR